MDFNKFIVISHTDDESAVGADSSRPSPHCISHKRGIAETWDPVWGTGNNAFQVPIYRPRGDPQHIPVNFFKTHNRRNPVWGTGIDTVNRPLRPMCSVVTTAYPFR